MKWQNGYTLIEILVALTIIGILFGFGYVNFRDFSRRQALAGVVKQVQGDLRLAQQMALSGQKPADCGSTLNGYNFNVILPNEYKIVANCSGTTPDSAKDVFLPEGINFDSASSVLFKVLGQGTSGGAMITLIQTSTNASAVIMVDPGGNIQ
jgi:prepilin-type N-terminal cleavage/methylation domain-containing protein